METVGRGDCRAAAVVLGMSGQHNTADFSYNRCTLPTHIYLPLSYDRPVQVEISNDGIRSGYSAHRVDVESSGVLLTRQ